MTLEDKGHILTLVISESEALSHGRLPCPHDYVHLISGREDEAWPLWWRPRVEVPHDAIVVFVAVSGQDRSLGGVTIVYVYLISL